MLIGRFLQLMMTIGCGYYGDYLSKLYWSEKTCDRTYNVRFLERKMEINKNTLLIIRKPFLSTADQIS